MTQIRRRTYIRGRSRSAPARGWPPEQAIPYGSESLFSMPFRMSDFDPRRIARAIREAQITRMEQSTKLVAMAPDGLGEAVLASASDAVVATDREGIITFWNPGAERIFGFAASEAVGRSLDLIRDNLRPRHWAGYRHVMAT